MKFIPILFNTEMVQALLAGRKTMTRRTKGLDNVNFNCTDLIKCAYGQVGDVLWVRETFAESKCLTKGCNEFSHYVYKADNDPLHNHFKWKPSLFMTKYACRLFLEITNIRVERLNDISETDAENEGIKLVEHNCYENYLVEKDWFCNGRNQRNYHMYQDPIGSYASLWNKINGIGSWGANPWVWVIEFQRVPMPSNFLEGK